jgi:hypothetical protein
MKKSIICAMSALCAFMTFADQDKVEDTTTYRDVYTVKATLKVPYLKSGVRSYSSQTLQGYLYVEYVGVNSEFDSAYMLLTNKKTKVVHKIDVTEGFLNMIGKASGKNEKYAPRSTPSIYFEGVDAEVNGDDAHELIKAVCFAGTGSLKDYKTTTTGCSMCGETTKTTAYCKKLYKMSGNVTGYMDCECPDDEDGWNHTMVKTLCGFEEDDDGYVRSHNASFWGTWSAVYNQKMSGEID